MPGRGCHRWAAIAFRNRIIEHAFNFVDTVVFGVGESNRRSQRAMEKIGGLRRPGLGR
jgi:hypothetical protein